jgi:DNA-binding MarR family transcriptional regulator
MKPSNELLDEQLNSYLEKYKQTQLFNKKFTGMLKEQELQNTLTLPQLLVLRRIIQHPGNTQAFIAETLNMDFSTFSLISEKLEEKGYITRTRLASNKRSYAVNPTDEGFLIYQKVATCFILCEVE